MTRDTPSKAGIILLAVLIGINLRPIMASIGPLLELMQHDLGLTNAEAGLLTTLPVMMMGLCALAGPWLLRLVGEVKGVGLGIALIALSCAARAYVDSAHSLIATAVLGGIGIAFIQALMPAFIKRSHPQSAGMLMGLFTTGIMGGAALAAATAAPGAAAFGWHLTLGFAAIPAGLALLAWLLWAGRTPTYNAKATLPYRHVRAWLLLVFFGIGTGAYTLVLAWLPPFYVEQGWAAADAGYLLGGLTLTEVLAGLLVSALIQRFPDRRPLLIGVIGLLIAGLACLMTAPNTLALFAIACLGLGIGALFPLSLIVTLDHASSPESAGELLAFVQGGGYLIAATMPLVAGFLRDQLSDLYWAWAVMIVGALVLLVLSGVLRPDGYRPMPQASRA